MAQTRKQAVEAAKEIGRFELLELAIPASGLSARKFAALLQVDERTVRYWLAGDREVPGPVGVICSAILDDPSIVHALAKASAFLET